MKLPIQGPSPCGGTVANLIFLILALGLCGLCTFQFKREGELRQALERLSRTNATVMGERDEARKEALRWKADVTEKTSQFAGLEDTIRSNSLIIKTLSSQYRGATNTVAGLTRNRDEYKDLFEQQRHLSEKATAATLKIKTEAEAELKRLAALAEERTTAANKCVQEYNELVRTFEKFRAQVLAPPPPAK